MIQSLQSQVQFAQDNINECQSNIVQVEESKVTVTLVKCLPLVTVFVQLVEWSSQSRQNV